MRTGKTKIFHLQVNLSVLQGWFLFCSLFVPNIQSSYFLTTEESCTDIFTELYIITPDFVPSWVVIFQSPLWYIWSEHLFFPCASLCIYLYWISPAILSSTLSILWVLSETLCSQPLPLLPSVTQFSKLCYGSIHFLCRSHVSVLP